MAINFSNGKEISELALNKLYAQGHIIQCVQTTSTSAVTLSANNQSDLFSLSITTSSNSSKVLAYLFLTERADKGTNRWSIFYNMLRYNGPGSGNGSNIIHSGWNGTFRFYLGNYDKYYLHSPGVAGTHTYTASARTYNQGTGYVNYGGNQGGTGMGIIRLMEVAG